jgi:outer membrane biosynthesis protein TonB
MRLPVAVLLFSLLLSLQAEIVPPAYPPDAISGGTVVAVLHNAEGAVTSVEILSGSDPFAQSARWALSRWRSEPYAPANDTLVVVRFRARDAFAIGGTVPVMAPLQADPALPYPTQIVEPAFPSGTSQPVDVVLLVAVTREGLVGAVRPVVPSGFVDETSLEAVMNWHFIPAHDPDGRPVAAQAYVVLAYPRPLL